MSCRAVLTAFAFASVVLDGCADKAQPSYAACVQAETTGDLRAAWTACNDAIAADPNSTSGKGAAAKMDQMKPRYDAWKEEQAKKAEASAAADRAAQAAQAKASAEAATRAAAALRQKITIRWDGYEPSGHCQAEGRPPFSKEYSGGTYAENAQVALGDGCQYAYRPESDNNMFCCPHGP